jgi:hypothetical protein
MNQIPLCPLRFEPIYKYRLWGGRRLTRQLSAPLPGDGLIENVVFPTGIDRRDDLGMPNRFDIYYEMADNRIGVAPLDMPERCRREQPLPRPKRRAHCRSKLQMMSKITV